MNKYLSSSTSQSEVVLVSMLNGFLPSYSMLYLDAYLSKKSINAKILYPLIEGGMGKGLIDKIIKSHPRIVGIGGLYGDRFAVKALIDALKPYRKDFKIVIGGNLVTPVPEFMVEKLGADIAVVGEGELIFSELAEKILGGADYRKICGLVLRENGKTVSTGAGEYIKDLSSIPALNYGKLPMEYFINVFKFYRNNTRTSSVYTPSTRLGAIPSSRSCFFNCNFCYHHNPMRQYKPLAIAKQANEFKERFNINLVRFMDDLTFIGKKQILDFCDTWLDQKVNLNYIISAHFSGLDEEAVIALKKSGCIQVAVGLESGSQKTLDRMNKKLKLEQVKYCLGLFEKHKILWNGAVQIGQLEETEREVKETIDFYYPYVSERSTISVCITTPYPGTPLYNYGLKTGKIKSHDEAFNRIKDLGSVAYNFSKIPAWKLPLLRFKMIFIFDVTKQAKSKGLLKGSAYFLKTLFLKTLRILLNG